jgi:hypothetical protein
MDNFSPKYKATTGTSLSALEDVNIPPLGLPCLNTGINCYTFNLWVLELCDVIHGSTNYVVISFEKNICFSFYFWCFLNVCIYILKRVFIF